MKVYISKFDEKFVDEKFEFNENEKGLKCEKVKAKRAEILETEEGYLTPVGVIKAPLNKVLDFICDLNYEVAYVKAKDVKFEESFEWVTLNSIISEIRKSEMSKECGAIVAFIGFVREIAKFQGKECRVKALKFEIYENLYSKKLREICNEVENKYKVKVRIYHKVGELKPGEDIVYVVVMGKTRKDVWKAAIEAVEKMKKDLPIWKKEIIEINGKVEERWL